MTFNVDMCIQYKREEKRKRGAVFPRSYAGRTGHGGLGTFFVYRGRARYKTSRVRHDDDTGPEHGQPRLDEHAACRRSLRPERIVTECIRSPG